MQISGAAAASLQWANILCIDLRRGILKRDSLRRNEASGRVTDTLSNYGLDYQCTMLRRVIAEIAIGTSDADRCR